MLDSLLFLYRDPLFGIAILVAIVVILVFADYGRNRYRAKKRQIALENFAKSYSSSSLGDELVEFLHLAKNPLPPLLLLAKTYAHAGDSAAAIKIYLNLLDSTKDPQEKIIILESLGIVYFEAGFLQRAKNIFLEILKTHPRNTQILGYLMRTHESMGEYKAALDALECLDELDTHGSQELSQELLEMKHYLIFMLLSQDSLLPLEKKHREIIALMHRSGRINRLTLEYLFTYDRERFWHELLLFEDVSFCLDILWRCKRDEVPIAQITSRADIMDIFIAKGFVLAPLDSKTESIVGESTPPNTHTNTNRPRLFALEVLRVLQAHSSARGTLSFEYRCHHCKNLFPFDSYRCPMCAKIGEMDLVYKIQESTQ